MKNSNTIHGYDWTGRKVLVTGASGFKGAWLAYVLQELGCKVYSLATHAVPDPFSSYQLLRLRERGLTELPVTDITTPRDESGSLFRAINEAGPFDVVFHLAATAQVTVARRDPMRALNVNVMGTLQLLEAHRLLQFKDTRMIIVSTDHVFGADEKLPRHGHPETEAVRVGGIYDTSKAMMEMGVHGYWASFADELPAIGITRSSNVFGYGDAGSRRVIPTFIRAAMDGQITLTCRRNGRQFIYIGDSVEGYILAASVLHGSGPAGARNLHRSAPQIFHFAQNKYGNRTPYVTIGDLAKQIAALFGAKVIEAADCVDFIPHENRVQALDCRKTFAHLGWRPQTTLRAGLERLKPFFAEERNSALTPNSRLHELMEQEAIGIAGSLVHSNESANAA